MDFKIYFNLCAYTLIMQSFTFGSPVFVLAYRLNDFADVIDIIDVP